jgi:hypothetical protein
VLRFRWGGSKRRSSIKVMLWIRCWEHSNTTELVIISTPARSREYLRYNMLDLCVSIILHST